MPRDGAALLERSVPLRQRSSWRTAASLLLSGREPHQPDRARQRSGERALAFAQAPPVAAWAVSVALTIAFVSFVFRHDLAAALAPPHDDAPTLRAGAGTLAVPIAATLVLALSKPALPVLALGVLVAVVGRLGVRPSLRAANPLLLLGVLGLALSRDTSTSVARSLSLRWVSGWRKGVGSIQTNTDLWASSCPNRRRS